MALNLTEVQQKANRNLDNLDRVIRAWNEFLTSPAGQVIVEYLDSQGVLQTKTIDNKEKIKADLLAVVSSVGGVKNRIINGDFAVWQRGTSFNAVGYTADRWRYDTDTDDSVSISKTNTTGNEPFTAQSYASIALTTGTTGNFNKFATRLEFPRLYFGKTYTLSFWAKANSPTTIDARLAFVFSGTEYSPVSQTVNVGTSWQRHTVTFALGTPSGFTESGSDYLDVALLLPVNTTVTIDIANVQLEEGDTATDFEYVPYDVQLMRCMRYYEEGNFKGGASDPNVLGFNWQGSYSINFAVKKRTFPTLKFVGLNAGGRNPDEISAATTGFHVLFIGSVDGSYYYWSGWTADAEL